MCQSYYNFCIFLYMGSFINGYNMRDIFFMITTFRNNLRLAEIYEDIILNII